MYDLILAERPGANADAISSDEGFAATRPREGDPALTQVLIELLKNAGRRLPEDRVEANSCISRALSLLEAERMRHEVEHETPARPTVGGLSPWRVRQVKRYIDDNLGATIRIEDLASVAKLSIRHFSLAFRQSFGLSPHAHIVKRRIEEARRLMLLTEDPLAQIALACGMADQAHLTRWFRRLVGVTPNAWRKQHQA